MTAAAFRSFPVPSGSPRRAAVGALVLLAWLAAGTACTGALPRPPFVSHPTTALVKVPFPPPPARVEHVPEQPQDGAVWIDGEWTWQGRLWAWTYGRWVVAPTGARYSPWTTVRDRAATLYFAAGVWRDAAGRPLRAPKPLAVARANEEDVPEDEGQIEDTGTNRAPPPLPTEPGAPAPQPTTAPQPATEPPQAPP
ncbi:MAG: hypothetical protein WKG00_06750 [Polyangiaceae bacterium]